MNLLITQYDCPFCKQILGIVEEVNMYLKPKDRILIKDITMWQEHGIELNPILSKFDWEGTPTLYLNGVVYAGLTTKEHLKGFLVGYFGLENG